MTVDHTAASAVTSVADDGSSEIAEFRGAPGARMFTYLYRPSVAPRGALLICAPLHGEFFRNYRREVLLARRLAGLGIAVLRFHYRFTGNSDGDERHLTFDSMREDALASYERLLAEFPSVPGFIAGTRWGAFVAASAAREHPDASVALWEPLLESARFFKDAFRRQLLRDVRQGIEAPTSSHELEERLLAGEAVDIVAHRLEASFYRSALGKSLEEELGPAPRRVLILQISSTGDLRPDLQRLVSRWVDAGFHVDAEARRGDTTAWLTDDRHGDPVARTLTGDVIDRTASWVSDQVVGAEA